MFHIIIVIIVVLYFLYQIYAHAIKRLCKRYFILTIY
jgi:hypothetical protein